MSLIIKAVTCILCCTMMIACAEEEPTNNDPKWQLDEPQIVFTDTEKKIGLERLNHREKLELSAYDEISFSMTQGSYPHLSIKSTCGPYVKHTDHSMPDKIRFLQYLPKEALTEDVNKTVICKIQFIARGSDEATHRFEIKAFTLKTLDPKKMIQLQREQTPTYWFNTENLMQTTVISDQVGLFEIQCDSFKGKSLAPSTNTYLYQMVLNNSGSDSTQEETCQIYQYGPNKNLINLSSKIIFRKQLPQIKVQLISTKEHLGAGWDNGQKPIQLMDFQINNTSAEIRYLKLSSFFFNVDLIQDRGLRSTNTAPYIPLKIKGLAKYPSVMQPHDRAKLILSLPYIHNCFSGSITMYYKLSINPVLVLQEFADIDKTRLIAEHQIIINEDFYLGNSYFTMGPDETEVKKYDRGQPTSSPYCPKPRAL